MQVTTLPTSPGELRKLIRSGALVRPTSGMAPGYVQTNLAILPRDMAFMASVTSGQRSTGARHLLSIACMNRTRC